MWPVFIPVFLFHQANESEEDSIGSTNGEGDHENGQKSPRGTKSPSHSSSSSQADYEGESPCSSRDSTDPSASNAPQQFVRVSKDHKSTCARTDLAYVHPPVEKKIATKVSLNVASVCVCLYVCVCSPLKCVRMYMQL